MKRLVPLLLLVIFLGESGSGKAKPYFWKEKARFDRMGKVEEFLRHFYPDLFSPGVQRLMTFEDRDNYENNFLTELEVYAELIKHPPCYFCVARPKMSPQDWEPILRNVLGPYYLPPVKANPSPESPKDGEEEKRKPLGDRPIWEAPCLHERAFDCIYARIKFTPAGKIHSFGIVGKDVGRRQAELLDRYGVGQTYLRVAQVQDALAKAGAKYPPSEIAEFRRVIPLSLIQELTDCRLRLSTLRFQSPYFSWKIDGSSEWNGQPCILQFEPFEGRLIGVWGL